MDVKQAAHGLNLSSASRVFFVNPIYSPALEAQAIKRAHRIGQTKPVFVETLVLEGTVEEAMLERSTNMTRDEHGRAAKSLTDDWGMAQIIQNARCLPISEDEMTGLGQMAKLDIRQQIFGRPGRNGGQETGLEKELFGAADEKPRREDLLAEAERGDTPTTTKRGKRKRTANLDLDVDEDREESTVLEPYIKPEPVDNPNAPTPTTGKTGKQKNKAAADVEADAAEDGEGSAVPKRKKAKRSKKSKTTTPAAAAAADTTNAQRDAVSTTTPAAAWTVATTNAVTTDTPDPAATLPDTNMSMPSVLTNSLVSTSPITTTTAKYTSIFDANVPSTGTPIPSIFTTPVTTSTRTGYSSIFGGG